MPEITVVITTYNLEAYIGACLEELFSGTYQDFDVVLVDDCSKDKTVSIIKAYAEKFPGRIHSAFLQKNLGSPAKTRNWALDSGFIDGKYVVFLDGDDSLEPEYLEKLHTLALQNGADVAVCAYDRVEEGSGRVLCTEMQGFPALMTLPPEDDTLAFINGALWNKLFRSDIALAHRIPDFKVGEDLCYQQAIYRDCSSIACTDEVLIHYRVRTASVISNNLNIIMKVLTVITILMTVPNVVFSFYGMNTDLPIFTIPGTGIPSYWLPIVLAVAFTGVSWLFMKKRNLL